MPCKLSGNQEGEKPSLEEILDFFYKFNRIHPFQDGNIRIGKLLMFKECLKNKYTPFIINKEDEISFYINLNQWEQTKAHFFMICKSRQNEMKRLLDHYKIKYEP